ncbi:MAG: hypothetical protein PWP37_1381, partial [Thermotogota bacterium]|nr:hypothetical protein [Thermotogota bacterium]
MPKNQRLGFSKAFAFHRSPNRLDKLIFLIALLLLYASGFTLDLRVGYFEAPPLSFEKNGVATGIFPELLSKIAEDEGWNITYKKITFSEGIDKVRSGELDILLAVAETPEYSEWAQFNEDPVLYSWGAIYVHPFSGLRNLDDLQGKRIAVVEGDVYYQEFKNLVSNFGKSPQFIEVKGNFFDVMKLVSIGEVDACIIDRIVGHQNAERFGLKSMGVVVSPVKLKLMFKKDIDEGVISVIDSYLRDWRTREGSYYYGVIERYLGGTIDRSFGKLYFWIIVIGAGTVAALLAIIGVLKRMVNKKTQDLMREKFELAIANEELMAMNRRLEVTQNELDVVMRKLEKLIDIAGKMEEKELSEEEFLKRLLDFAVENVPEADYGSIWIIEEDKWKLIAAVGHDEALLKTAEVRKEYMHLASDVEIVDVMKRNREVFPPDINEIFERATMPVKLAMIAPLKVHEEVIGNFALDIAEGSEKNFSESSVKLMKSLTTLASSF